MKFVSDATKLKKNYLYQIKNRNISEIILVTTNFSTSITAFNITKNTKYYYPSFHVSKIKETDKDFKNSITYAFYEIGSSEQYPEYLL